MEIYAFVGPSGTGKSFKVSLVAHEYGIETIIDDGLIIHNNKIAGGMSAKNEPTKMAAVRIAIFSDRKHADMARKKLQELNPDKLLILGTSIKMIELIIGALALPPIGKTIHIQDVATKEEIAKARESRLRDGQHIIPVSKIEVKPHFMGYLLDSLEVFLKGKQNAKRVKIAEKTIVRPPFSFIGKLYISEVVIASIVHHIASQNPVVTHVDQIKVMNWQDNDKGKIVSIEVALRYGCKIMDVTPAIQHEVKEAVEHMTGLNVCEVNVEIKRLTLE